MPTRIPAATPPERVAELLRLDEEWGRARRTRRTLFTAAALSSISWLLRFDRVTWLPAHALDLGVALWGTVLSVALVFGVHEWRLRRRFERLAATLQPPSER